MSTARPLPAYGAVTLVWKRNVLFRFQPEFGFAKLVRQPALAASLPQHSNCSDTRSAKAVDK